MHNHTPIIILSATEWQDNPVSTMHIAAELSKSRKVIFVETPGRRFPKLNELGRALNRIKRFLKRKHAPLTRGLDPQNVSILSPIAIPAPKYSIIRIINTYLLTFQLKKSLKKHAVTNPILWVFSPYWLAITKKILHQTLIFHCVDALHTYDNSKFFQNALIAVTKQANTVFTPGLLIHETLKKYNPNTHLVGHGCSNNHLTFKSTKPLAELNNIPKPIAIYAGCLANWVDYDLLIHCAKQLPEVSFVLLGYIHSLAPKSKIDALLTLKNVHSFGYINYAKLPEFYAQSDVGIIPYQENNEHIYYCTPTKILDYFAARLPCVSTKYPAAEKMKDLLFVARDHDDFVNGIKCAFSTTETTKTKLYAYAQQHSWPAQVSKMLSAIHTPSAVG